MDQLILNSKFMKGILSRLISKFIFDKYGEKIEINIDDVSLKHDESNNLINFKLGIHGNCSNEIVKKMIFK